MSQNNSKKAGFTLIEMSIVLVIIGLIVGGVLVGRDLIENAKTNSLVSQVNNMNTAINTFKDKYQQLPGDTNKSVAFFGAGSTDGDNDGTIEVTTINTFDGEAAEFWVHLSAADMAGGAFDGTDVAGTGFPSLKTNVGGLMAIGLDISRNYLVVGTTNGLVVTGTDGSLTPAQAFGLDSKLDDGVVVSGTIQAVDAIAYAAGGFGTETTATSANNANCVAADDENYNLNVDLSACTVTVEWAI